MTNPLTDPYLILSKIYSEGAYLKQAIASTPIEPANRARTVKICYGVLEKDVYLNYVIEHNAASRPKASVRLILKIAVYMLEFMGKHDYMVVDSAVELTKKLGKQGAAGFVNAFLRSYKIPAMPENPVQRLSVEASAPEWLVKKIRRSYKSRALAILTAPSHGVSVRFVRGAEKYLSNEHEETPFDGLYIFPNFVRDSGFDSGDYTFQSIGSVAICSAISPCERLLDACAAPGGKSVLLTSKCRSVVACELHSHRVELIRAYAARMGADVQAMQADAMQFIPKFEGAFDAVLCDAPCSGTGVINENPDIKLHRKEEDIPALVDVQKKILLNCARYVKAGGRLYYSTCSVLPEENDSAACALLEARGDFTSVQLSSPLAHEKTKRGLQFLPDVSQGAGFYIAAFERKV